MPPKPDMEPTEGYQPPIDGDRIALDRHTARRWAKAIPARIPTRPKDATEPPEPGFPYLDHRGVLCIPYRDGDTVRVHEYVPEGRRVYTQRRYLAPGGNQTMSADEVQAAAIYSAIANHDHSGGDKGTFKGAVGQGFTVLNAKKLRTEETHGDVTEPAHTDELAKVSANDTTAGYLKTKITSTGGTITITEVSDGGDERLNLEVAGGGGEQVKVSSNDTTTGYLNGKLVAGTNIDLTENNDGADETLEVDVDPNLEGKFTFTHTSDTETPVTITAETDVALGVPALDLHKQMSTSAADSDGPNIRFLLTDAEGGPNSLASIGGGRLGADNTGLLAFGVSNGGTLRIPQIIYGNGLIAVQDRAQNTYDLVTLLRGQAILEQTFERLLQGTLSSGNATPTNVTYTFGSDASDNNGIATWSAGWSSIASCRRTTTAGQTADITFRTTGGDVVLDRSTEVMFHDNAVAVTLDGSPHGTWNQATAQTYTLTGLSAGVHTVRITSVNARVDGGLYYYCALASITVPEYPYQGVGVNGDGGVILAATPGFFVTSIGTANTDNGARYPREVLGEAITPRLPLGSALTDASFTRQSCLQAGCTLSAHSNGLLQIWPAATRGNTGAAKAFLWTGATLRLSATAGTRGQCAAITPYDIEAAGYDLAASVAHLAVWPMLVKITATGAGSAFQVDDLALAVLTLGETSAYARIASLDNWTAVACDLFKIPSDLL